MTELLLDDLARLHHASQWQGWRRWVRLLGREPMAYVEAFCPECMQAWPCRTAQIVFDLEPGND